MRELPRITIVTPSFNDGKFLESTMRSVLDQGYPNLEYIVIDGGSNDNSVEIIRKFEKQLSYWISEKDQGMYFAIKKGFERSTGEIMGWINSDDMLHPGSLFTIGQIFRDCENVEWIQGVPNVIDENGRVVMVFSWPELGKLYFYKHTRDRRKYIQQESTFWRSSLWKRAGAHVSTEYRYAGDFELWTRFFRHASLYNVPALLGSFRVSQSGQASVDNFNAYVEETSKILLNYPLSRREKRKLQGIELTERAASAFKLLYKAIRNRFGLNDESSWNDRIYFDNASQCFKAKKST